MLLMLQSFKIDKSVKASIGTIFLYFGIGILTIGMVRKANQNILSKFLETPLFIPACVFCWTW